MAHRGRGPRRSYDWAGMFFGPTTLAATQVILGSALIDNEPVTVMRVRGNILVKGTPDAVADDNVVGLGLIVLQSQAFTAGGASVPGPIADPSAPWLWH